MHASIKSLNANLKWIALSLALVVGFDTLALAFDEHEHHATENCLSCTLASQFDTAATVEHDAGEVLSNSRAQTHEASTPQVPGRPCSPSIRAPPR